MQEMLGRRLENLDLSVKKQKRQIVNLDDLLISAHATLFLFPSLVAQLLSKRTNRFCKGALALSCVASRF
jgi:hypothetical protein